jgi:alpha-1,6-mannosyltransferase
MIKSAILEQVQEESRQGKLALILRPGVVLAIGLALAWFYNWGGYLHRFSQGISAYIALFILQFALYLAACYFVFRKQRKPSRSVALVTAGIIVLLAGIFRGELAGKPPYLSTDAYRYVWDGQVQAHHINPYRYKPTAEQIADLRDDRVFPKINGADYSLTPYPPVAQMIYLFVDLIHPLSVTAFKVAVLVMDMITIVAIMLVLARAGMDPSRAVIFAWHPLLIWEGAHSGHVDSAFIAFLALGLLAWTYKKPAMTGVALGAATLIKLYPIMLLPVFLCGATNELSEGGAAAQSGYGGLKEVGARLRQALLGSSGRKTILGLLVTIVVCYLPYLTVGRAAFGYLTEYIEEEGFVNKGGRYFLLALGRELVPIPTAIYSGLAVVALAAVGLVWIIKTKRDVIDVARGSIAIIGLYLVLTTPRYPWYYCWIVPFLCFIPRLGWIYLTGATILLYTLWFIPNEYPNLPLWLGAAMYVPALVMLALDHFRRPDLGEAVPRDSG